MSDTVVLPRAEYERLEAEAEAWREVADYAEALHFRATSSAISAAEDWRAVAYAPSFAELRRRRSTYDRPPLTAEQIKARARASWARFEAHEGVA